LLLKPEKLKQMKKSLVLLSLILFGFFNAVSLKAQMVDPIKWSYNVIQIDEQHSDLIITANIEKGWHLYSQKQLEGATILPLVFEFETSPKYTLIGGVKEPAYHEEYDEFDKVNIRFFKDNVVFKQRIKVLSDTDFKIKGSVSGQACLDVCVLVGDDFSFSIKAAKADINNGEEIDETEDTIIHSNEEEINETEIVETSTISEEDEDDVNNMSLWGFFIAAILGGLIAVLTPCVYPMIPMTVSYFIHQSGNKAKAKFQAIVFGISIIVIFLIIGTLVAVTLGESFTNWLSTHWIPNIFFFLLFAIFAASFFGMFEITLPSWLVNKSDKKAEKGGLFGAFFMAFTLVLVSFSCTAPIAGSILALSTQGEIIRPIVGMFGYSLAFAIPFTLFAFFPSALDKMPKSGGWLNAVKVVIGFIELALALKFLSVADQTYHWGILDREIYLALWIVIFSLLGFYLLGKLKFAHDSPMTHVPVPRLILAIISFSFVVYMIPGLFGAPLKALSGWTPPMSTHDFDFQKIVRENSQGGSSNNSYELCNDPKHSDKLHLPHGLKGYFDVEQALACAKEQNKPIFLDFTGHGCVNCREMEANVWSDPKVLKILREDYIILALYVDDKNIKLEEDEFYISDYDGKEKTTLGAKNFDYQKSKFNANAQPYYVLMGLEEEALVKPRSYDLDIDEFISFLEKGKEEFKKKYE
jgi:thiol:disulfide interchange protein